MKTTRARFAAGLPLVILAWATSGCSRPFDALHELQSYDVVWDRPGNDSKGSMPVGNGDIGLNVWAEADTGSVCFYIGKTDSWDENGRLLKLTKVRIKLDPNPFGPGVTFQQRLNLGEATVEVRGALSPIRYTSISGSTRTIRSSGSKPGFPKAAR